MITEHDLQEAIAECEGVRNPNASTCMKLAAFYTIKDKMYPERAQKAQIEPVSYSMAASPTMDNKIEYEGDTAFSTAIHGMDMQKLIPVIDELMSTLQVVSPRIYDGVMRKLSDS